MEKRIFGATDGIREKVGESPLRPNTIRTLGKAISKFFNNNRLLIGRDTRESGMWIDDELAAGAKAQGGSTGDLGVLPTPAVQKIISERDGIEGGVMITASHNPASDNGLKVFLSNGDKLSDEQEIEIEENFFAEKLDDDENLPEVSFEQDDNPAAVRDYIEMASEALGLDTEEIGGETIILDAASGAGHNFSKSVLEEFNVEVERIDPEPDGKNINAHCGALFPENVAKAAKEAKCMGVALDGDADRIILADEEGRIWDGDRIVVLFAEYLHEKGELSEDTVVLTEYSNYATEQYLANIGIKVEKVVNGDRAVVKKCQDVGAILGGELAGHIIYLPWLNGSDGTFSALFALKIIREKGCRLSDLWAKYDNMPSRQWAVEVREKKPLEDIPEWNGALSAATNRLNGAGRVFTRYSGTENKLRILVEGNDIEVVEEVGDSLRELVEKELGK